MIQLRAATDRGWVEVVLADFDRFLVDHAACERKASANGLSFVVRYPDRTHLLGPCIAFAREELEHFEMVYALIAARGLTLEADEPDPYMAGMAQWVRTGRNERLLDRLVLAAVAEARGCERFGLVRDALRPGDLKTFYADITRSEARHAGLFLRLARHYFSSQDIDGRVDSLLDVEADLIRTLPHRPALH